VNQYIVKVYRQAQGSTTEMPQPSKSALFRVATDAFRVRAIAAIMASSCGIGRADRLRSDTIPA